MWGIYNINMPGEYPEFNGFEWDDGNKHKNAKHGVYPWECEQVFFNQPLIVLEDPKHSLAENRKVALGKTGSNRLLIVVYTIRKNLIRVISARAMNKAEREFYEKH